MFRVLFLRNTHDAEGNYKVEQFQNLNPDDCACLGIGVHSFVYNKWTSFDEYVQENVKYFKDHDCENCLPTIQELTSDLITLLTFGLVVAEIRDDGNPTPTC